MMSQKRRASDRLRAWIIFAAIFGMTTLLLLVEARLALPAGLSRLMQLAIVALAYGLLAVWINIDPGAIL
jgi:hypothetical protein